MTSSQTYSQVQIYFYYQVAAWENQNKLPLCANLRKFYLGTSSSVFFLPCKPNGSANVHFILNRVLQC